jgi:hypothetical protein
MQRLLAAMLGDEITLEIATAAGLWPIFADQIQLETILIALIANVRGGACNGGKVRIDAVNALPDTGNTQPNPANAFVDVTVTATGAPGGLFLEVGRQPQFQLIRTMVEQNGGEILMRNNDDPQGGAQLRLPCRPRSLGAPV